MSLLLLLILLVLLLDWVRALPDCPFSACCGCDVHSVEECWLLTGLHPSVLSYTRAATLSGGRSA